MTKLSVRDPVCAEVVRLLSEERKRQGLSMNLLASQSGLSQSLISTLESTPWNPTLDTLLRISHALNVDLGKVITKAEKNAAEVSRKGRGG